MAQFIAVRLGEALPRQHPARDSGGFEQPVHRLCGSRALSLRDLGSSWNHRDRAGLGVRVRGSGGLPRRGRLRIGRGRLLGDRWQFVGNHSRRGLRRLGLHRQPRRHLPGLCGWRVGVQGECDRELRGSGAASARIAPRLRPDLRHRAGIRLLHRRSLGRQRGHLGRDRAL